MHGVTIKIIYLHLLPVMSYMKMTEAQTAPANREKGKLIIFFT